MQINLGLTPIHACSYLSGQQERLGVVMDEIWHQNSHYELLLAAGYRRSGDIIYKPMCPKCSACTPIRYDVMAFTPSRSLKRLKNQIQSMRWHFSSELDPQWFSLYQQYINTRHQDGSMYPADRQSFLQFSHSEWQNIQYLHLYQEERLIAIAVTDITPHALSAVYSFFDPQHKLSLGSACLLIQLEQAKIWQKTWIYPGYFIEQCQKMNYKSRFHPHEKLSKQGWQR
ncbi:Aspartate/glutamate leucyltransferase [Vibrio stylophorae]|uniref:Aspartate/glutamate leucyltransferase n=1 Tax=Vibrio stylophorae TaxID=659351 RepID=A0ABM8ZSS8_9VIBR|nr:arginyltransferase [Vibrio stylophorae]CAH0533366.1 Aspartate/glutamate leucyltransferase [Vibrio stylophorae]